MSGNDTSTENLVPLVIGVTGHRDLAPAEMDHLQAKVGELFSEVRGKFPNTPLRLLTSLAEGADRLAARAAIASSVELHVVLPMPAHDYRRDFGSPESVAEFDELCEQAEVHEPLTATSEQIAMRQFGSERDFAYANAGMFISTHCHILLALWDGVFTEQLGGTSQIVYFHHFDKLHGVIRSAGRSSLFLTDDESDLVYHISCSRSGGATDNPKSPPFQTRWYTTDVDTPVTTSIPPRYVRVLKRADEFNADLVQVAHHLSRSESSVAPPPETKTERDATRIRIFFDSADGLANLFQRRIDRALAAIYGLAVLTGLTFILFSDVLRRKPIIFAFLAFLILTILLARLVRKRQWHRKYLDYRVLAEGLRVQYFWAIAGIHAEGHTKFAYDNFLRQRDMELGWIRNVMRVAGTVIDARKISVKEAGVQFAIKHWIGDSHNPGQLEYYRRKAALRARMNRITDAVVIGGLWGGIVVGFILAFLMADVDRMTQDSLIVIMGVLPLIAGIAETYTQRKADRELVKQYRFMEHVFENARHRLEQAKNDRERRDILQGLGDAALTEHAEWILIHRERQPEPAGI